MKLSVVIIVKNEAETIADCITAVSLLKPATILVVDTGSTDGTIAIAQSHDVRVVSHPFVDFAEVHTWALKQIASDWVLYIDADERVSPQLAEEIKQNIEKTTYTAFSLTRVNYYLGKQWPKTEQTIRLFQKQALLGWKGELHETAQFKGSAGFLLAPLFHHTHRTLTAMVNKTIYWSDIEARLRFENKHPPIVWWRIPRVMVPTFWDYYVRQGGWKVGTIGLIESMYQAFSIGITYIKLWELQKQ